MSGLRDPLLEGSSAVLSTTTTSLAMSWTASLLRMLYANGTPSGSGRAQPALADAPYGCDSGKRGDARTLGMPAAPPEPLDGSEPVFRGFRYPTPPSSSSSSASNSPRGKPGFVERELQREPSELVCPICGNVFKTLVGAPSANSCWRCCARNNPQAAEEAPRRRTGSEAMYRRASLIVSRVGTVEDDELAVPDELPPQDQLFDALVEIASDVGAGRLAFKKRRPYQSEIALGDDYPSQNTRDIVVEESALDEFEDYDSVGMEHQADFTTRIPLESPTRCPSMGLTLDSSTPDAEKASVEDCKEDVPRQPSLPACKGVPLGATSLPSSSLDLALEAAARGTQAAELAPDSTNSDPPATKRCLSNMEAPIIGASVTLSGVLWKRRSNLSRAAKLYRLLQKEAEDVTKDGWLSGLGTEKVAKLAREIVVLVGSSNSATPPLARLMDSPPKGTECLDEPTEAKLPDDEGVEALWSRRHVWLCGSTLVWAKTHEDKTPGVVEIGPLWGSSVELLGGVAPRGRHAFRLFPATRTKRHRPLAFSAATAADAERWVRALDAACAFPLQRPVPRSRAAPCYDICRGLPPPRPGTEPPPAVLRLEILRVSGLSGAPETKNPFVLCRSHDCHIRTLTRYQVGADAEFGQTFIVPIEVENADSCIQFEVFHEPEFEDHEPALLGGINVPLWTLGRRRRVEMSLPLRTVDTMRSGVVNSVFGQLTIAAMFEQNTGHLWLPAEYQLPSGVEEPPADMVDFQKQIGRLFALLAILNSWISDSAYVLQWEQTRLSLVWFAFFQLWVLVLNQWTLAILFALLLRCTWSLRHQRPLLFGFKEIDVDLESGQGRSPWSWRSESKEAKVGPTEQRRDTYIPPDRFLWEVERRLVFAGFSSSYLHDLDPPLWSDEAGTPYPGPSTLLEDGEKRFRFRWKVVVSEDTDENGWQYAPSFTSDEWRSCYDTLRTWVRRRKHHGRWASTIEKGLTKLLPSSVDDTIMLGIERSLGDLGRKPSTTFTEANVTENGLINRYMQIYIYIRNDVDYWFTLIEKHLNLFRWKDRTVTAVVSWIIAGCTVVALFLPTRFISSLLVDFAFYIGWLFGKAKRKARRDWIDRLDAWCKTLCRIDACLKGSDPMTKLEELGITRLAIRNWCNQTWRAGLDLRSIDHCVTLTDLADLVIAWSPLLNKPSPRYRAWHSDVYNNFLDHVPSDALEHDIASICYHVPFSAPS